METDDDSAEDLSDLYRDLNARFYSASPGRYLHTRWLLPGAMAGNRAGVDALLSEGAQFQDLVFTATTEPIDGHCSHEHVAYVVTESQALLHHASETLLRLAFAHMDKPSCPWMEIARLRLPGTFKHRVQVTLTWPSSRLDRLAGFLFAGDPSSEAGLSCGRAMARLLRAASREVTERAVIYKSVKHGLSVVAGESALWFFSENDPEPTPAGGTGPSITYLDSLETLEDREWSEHTEWIDLRSSLLLTRLLIMVIEAMWSIAAASYAGSALGQVMLPTKEAVDAALLETGRDHGLVRWRRGLLVELPS